MRKFVLMLAVGAALTGVAHAGDYVVVRSTDPAIARGATFDAGSEVTVAPSSSVAVLSSGGALTTLQGGKAKLPPLASSSGASTASTVSAILTRNPPRRVMGATRGAGVCPTLEDLKTLEQILAAEAAECRVVSRLALEAYIDAQSGNGVAAEAAATPKS